MASYSTWTIQQNQRFELALSEYEDLETDDPNFFEKLAKAVGGKTVEEIKIHYKELVEDIKMIEEELQTILYNDLPMDCPPEDQESSNEEEKPMRLSKKSKK